jgi:hypothetical protein
MAFNKRFRLFLFISGFLLGCNSNSVETTLLETPTPNITLDKENLSLDAKRGLFLWEDKPFSGISTLHQMGVLVEEIHFHQGKKQGSFKKWFDDGTLSFEAYYHQGKKDSTCKSWWRNGQLRSLSNFNNGVPHGKQYSWYDTGEKFKETNLEHGKEKGLQRAWRKNGTIYNNYEAKNGRIFGLKRANLCYEIEEEDIKR